MTCLLTGRCFLFPVPHTGYSFLQPAQAEIFARQQEMLRKQNLARCVYVCVFGSRV